MADEAYVDNAIAGITTGGGWIDTNTNYLLTSAYLVFFMHCGFAMVRFISFVSFKYYVPLAAA